MNMDQINSYLKKNTPKYRTLYVRGIVEYVDRCMVNSIESIQRDVKLDVVFSRIKDGDLFTLDYMRLSDDGNMSYHQMAFALAGEPGETENLQDQSPDRRRGDLKA